MACEARRELDEMVCRCGKRWDTKDPAPPVCQQDRPTTNFLFNSGSPDPSPLGKDDRRYFVVKPRTSAPTQVACRPPRPIAALIPATLAPDVAYAMAKSYDESRAKGCERIGAMHAAYKAFLDSLRK